MLTFIYFFGVILRTERMLDVTVNSIELYRLNPFRIDASTFKNHILKYFALRIIRCNS